jgi:hypothetical protein
MTAHFMLGDLRCAVNGGERYASMLAGVYGVTLVRGSSASDLVIDVRDDLRPAPGPHGDRLIAHRTPSGCVLESDPMTCVVRADAAPTRVSVAVHDPAMREDLLAYHFWILMNRALLAVDRVLLHAAGLRFRSSVSLFIGPKGAGKSTIAIALARAGAELIAEDHLLGRRAGGRTLVSGCSGRLRVTARTERHFLDGLLDGETAIDVSGVPKKQFAADRFFAARPHAEQAVDRVFFPRVGDRFGVRAMSRRLALLRTVDAIGSTVRLHDRRDHADFLALLAELLAVPCYELELSPRLDDLGRLVDLLERGP